MLPHASVLWNSLTLLNHAAGKCCTVSQNAPSRVAQASAGGGVIYLNELNTYTQIPVTAMLHNDFTEAMQKKATDPGMT